MSLPIFFPFISFFIRHLETTLRLLSAQSRPTLIPSDLDQAISLSSVRPTHLMASHYHPTLETLPLPSLPTSTTLSKFLGSVLSRYVRSDLLTASTRRLERNLFFGFYFIDSLLIPCYQNSAFSFFNIFFNTFLIDSLSLYSFLIPN